MKAASFQRDQVVDIINSVLVRVRAPQELSREALARELTDLKGIIDDLRRDLHAARPGDISSDHIPTATDELDAVVGTTEQATTTIMDCCDGILEQVKAADPQVAAAVEQHVVQIFEACTFQDITGQRIKKVTNSLKLIDEKIKSVLAVIGGQLAAIDIGPAPKAAQADPLLNGPALPADAVSQDDIDRLLAEFDTAGKV